MKYDWPGNVRELENTIERAIVIAKGNSIGLEGLPPSLRMTEKEPTKFIATKKLDDVEKEHIAHVLEVNNWNIKKTAYILGVDRTTLYNKIKKYNLKKI